MPLWHLSCLRRTEVRSSGHDRNVRRTAYSAAPGTPLCLQHTSSGAQMCDETLGLAAACFQGAGTWQGQCAYQLFPAAGHAAEVRCRAAVPGPSWRRCADSQRQQRQEPDQSPCSACVPRRQGFELQRSGFGLRGAAGSIKLGARLYRRLQASGCNRGSSSTGSRSSACSEAVSTGASGSGSRRHCSGVDTAQAVRTHGSSGPTSQQTAPAQPDCTQGPGRMARLGSSEITSHSAFRASRYPYIGACAASAAVT